MLVLRVPTQRVRISTARDFEWTSGKESTPTEQHSKPLPGWPQSNKADRGIQLSISVLFVSVLCMVETMPSSSGGAPNIPTKQK